MFKNLFNSRHTEPQVPPCDHRGSLVLIGKMYAKPITLPFDQSLVNSGLSDSMLMALVGMTTFVWQCTVCGEVKKEIFFGTEGVPQEWEGIFDKVKGGGPQVVESAEGEKFLVGRYTPPEGTLPLH